MKGISFKVKDSELERLNYYKDTPEGGKTIIANFVKDAIREKCERIQQSRRGDLLMSFPNPASDNLSDEQKANIMEIYKEADLKVSRIAPGVMGLSELIAYYHYHFFKITDRQRKVFEDNFIQDLTMEAAFDDLEDIEFDAVQERGAKAFEEDEK